MTELPVFFTCFEILSDASRNKYKTSRILSTRQEIYDFCKTRDIPILLPEQIISYQIQAAEVVSKYEATEL
jgi:hypothetical protein